MTGRTRQAFRRLWAFGPAAWLPQPKTRAEERYQGLWLIVLCLVSACCNVGMVTAALAYDFFVCGC